MYKKRKRIIGDIDLNTSVEGETIEQQISRMINNGEPIESVKEGLYTKPSDGVKYGTDIRGDKWDKALDTVEKMEDYRTRMKVVKEDESGIDGGEETPNNHSKSGSEGSI